MKKFRRVICILLLVAILCSMNFGCVNASMYTEEEHLARIEKRVQGKIDDWEYGNIITSTLYGDAIELEKCSYEGFAVYPVYNEKEEFSYALIEFAPYGFAFVYIDNFDHGLIDALLNRTMYAIERLDAWYPYNVEYDFTANAVKRHYTYDENGNVLYYKKSPYYIHNNNDARKYLIYAEGVFIPAIKNGELFVNLISGEEFDIADENLYGTQASLGGMFYVGGKNNDI